MTNLGRNSLQLQQRVFSKYGCPITMCVDKKAAHFVFVIFGLGGWGGAFNVHTKIRKFDFKLSETENNPTNSTEGSI